MSARRTVEFISNIEPRRTLLRIGQPARREKAIPVGDLGPGLAVSGQRHAEIPRGIAEELTHVPVFAGVGHRHEKLPLTAPQFALDVLLERIRLGGELIRQLFPSRDCGNLRYRLGLAPHCRIHQRTVSVP